MVMPSSVNMDPNADPLIGHKLGGKYTLQQMIGRGGMGHVYSATTEDGDHAEVVVKMIAPPLAQQPQAMARFEREAKRLDGLRHSNIVEMFDYGRDGGRAYIVMEYVDGELLNDYMSHKGRLTLAEFVPIAAQILKGVGHAHSRDLMIRDIKPANVMLCERKGRANFVKIIDFGLAKMLEGEEDITKQHFIGTSGYLSPEQIKGIEIDLRVDVYALGVLFYQMLSGRMPFEAENDTTLLYKHVHEFPTPLSEVLPDEHGVPDELIHLIHDCLEKDPDQRPRDANEIVEKLIDCVPMAMFKLPAVTETAAHQAISALSTAALAAPTGETATYLRREEIEQGAGASASASVAPVAAPVPDTQDRPVVAAATLGEEPKKSNTGLIIGAVVVAAAAAVAAVLFMGDKPEPEPTPEAQPAAAAEDAGSAELEAAVAEAEKLVGEGDFKGASSKLDRVRGQLDSAPQLKGTVERLDQEIQVGQLMATAKQLDEEGLVDAAVKAYQDVVAVDPSNTEARKRIAELTGAPAPAPAEEPAPEEDSSGDKKKKKADKSDKKKKNEPKPAAEPKPEPKPEPKDSGGDNPFMPTKKKKKASGPFL